jgi:hypothetical protein
MESLRLSERPTLSRSFEHRLRPAVSATRLSYSQLLGNERAICCRQIANDGPDKLAPLSVLLQVGGGPAYVGILYADIECQLVICAVISA